MVELPYKYRGPRWFPVQQLTFSLAPITFVSVTNAWNGQDTFWQGKELAGTIIFFGKDHVKGGDGQTDLLQQH